MRSSVVIKHFVSSDGCSEKGMLGPRNPVFIYLLEHPFFFGEKNQRIIQARVGATLASGHVLNLHNALFTEFAARLLTPVFDLLFALTRQEITF
jgi:hypothetical protein